MEFDTKKFKVYTWKHWFSLHWILNPTVALNELAFGQRIPKISIEDIVSYKPKIDRLFVPCPHCGKMHDHRTWSTQNGTAFKNWFGLYCPNCGQTIPCLMNWASWIILAITFPIWGWFKNSLKAAWLNKQPERFANLYFEGAPNPYENGGWVLHGLSFGLFTLILTEIVFPLSEPEGIAWKHLLLGIPIYALFGLGWGYLMKFVFGKSANLGSTKN